MGKNRNFPQRVGKILWGKIICAKTMKIPLREKNDSTLAQGISYCNISPPIWGGVALGPIFNPSLNSYSRNFWRKTNFTPLPHTGAAIFSAQNLEPYMHKRSTRNSVQRRWPLSEIWPPPHTPICCLNWNIGLMRVKWYICFLFWKEIKGIFLLDKREYYS